MLCHAGLPEPLAFWVSAAPIEFTTLDDTKITVKMTKADTATGREGHSTDNRWGMILQPRKDGTHYTEMAADAAEVLASVGITVTPASIKEMRNKITKRYPASASCSSSPTTTTFTR